MSSRLFTRAALVGGLALAVFAATPAAASSPPTHNRADAAAGWLARQMVDGERFEAVFDGVAYPDQGLTVDAVFAFAATGTADDHADRAMSWLASPGITGGYIGEGTESYAGATAKLSLAVQVRGGDPSAFGGFDLEARLRALETASGRFSDASQWGDFSNSFSQSLAVLSLDRTTGGAPSTAVAFLAGTRCADGGYPLLFGQATCASDVDATAVAVQAFLATGRWSDASAGLNWLVSVQSANGAFSALGVENANSTGLASQALLAGGRLAATVKARVFLRGLQVDCAGAAADRGAIRFKTGPFDPATATRATAQAILGLGLVSLAHLDATGAQSGDPVLSCQ